MGRKAAHKNVAVEVARELTGWNPPDHFIRSCPDSGTPQMKRSKESQVPRQFPSVSIFITAIVYLFFAVWLGGNPNALLEAFDLHQSTPQMLTEIRAFYGGVELAIAVAMLWLWWRKELFAAALVGGLPLVGSASGRILGQFLDGYSMLHLRLASAETVGAAVCLLACWQVWRKASFDSKHSTKS